MAKRAGLDVNLKVEFIPLPFEREAAWRASLLLLVDWIVEDIVLHPEEANDGIVDADRIGDDGGARIALFPVETVAEG